MKKLIAKTTAGKEFLHSRVDAFFASNYAQKIADALNKNKYKLSGDEKWHVYDYDYSQDFYVNQSIFISNGRIKSKWLEN